MTDDFESILHEQLDKGRNMAVNFETLRAMLAVRPAKDQAILSRFLQGYRKLDDRILDIDEELDDTLNSYVSYGPHFSED